MDLLCTQAGSARRTQTGWELPSRGGEKLAPWACVLSLPLSLSGPGIKAKSLGLTLHDANSELGAVTGSLEPGSPGTDDTFLHFGKYLRTYHRQEYKNKQG